MLDFCTVADAKALMNFGERYNASLEDQVKSVTERFNNYLRRRLDYGEGLTETFNIPRLKHGERYPIWLERKNLEPGSIVLLLSQQRDFTDPDLTTLEETSYQIDHTRGRITLYGYLPQALDGLRITYSGGYPPREEPNDTAMDCPANLRSAAVEQVVYDVNRLVNSFAGSNEADKKAQPSLSSFGLLKSVTDSIHTYRRLLG
jgi:hypothetical protein